MTDKIAASLVGGDGEVIDLVQGTLVRMNDPQATWVGYFKLTSDEALEAALGASSLCLVVEGQETLPIELVRLERDAESGEHIIRFMSRTGSLA
jgi:hypothetical protein